MLPFLKNKHSGTAGLSIKYRAPDETSENNNENSELERAAKDLMQAVHSQDHKAVASALKAAFDLLDSEPHVEGPHINEEEIKE